MFKFRKRLLSYSIISKASEMGLQVLSGPIFSKQIKNMEFRHFWNSRNGVFENGSRFFLELFGGIWWAKNLEYLVRRVVNTSKRSGNHENVIFRVFQKWILKATNPKWSNINLRSFSATFSWIFTIKMVPQTSPDPRSASFPKSPRLSSGNRHFVGLGKVEPFDLLELPRKTTTFNNQDL